mgnify:CR=1 FL=1
MMGMAVRDRAAGIYRIAEGGSVQIGLHVMGCQGVPAEQHPDESFFD